MLREFIFFLICTLSHQLCFSWGPTGHRITAAIAEKHLSPTATSKIKKILGSQSLAEISTWADEVRSDPDRNYYGRFDPWHYVNIPHGQNYEQTKKNPRGDILTAIQKMQETLKSDSSTETQKKEALALLVHFLGDLHQPLHIGNGQDRGSNFCFVKWFNENVDLHTLWDETLINFSRLSYTEYMTFVDQSTEAERLSFSKGTPIDWAQEMLEVRQKLYPTAPLKDQPFCKKTEKETILEKAKPVLGYDYHYQHKKLLHTQLLKGGVRLAFILNSLF